MISNDRIKSLNDKETLDKSYVVYWMQSAQRTEWNHSLEYAIMEANDLGKPLIVYFGLTDQFPEANERHYCFMLEGLKEVKEELRKRKIKLVIMKISPEIGALRISEAAALVVVDRGYLKIERQWREYLGERAECAVIQVETNVIVPIETASIKEEYSAATLRNKLNKKLEQFIVGVEAQPCTISSLELKIPVIEFEIEEIDSAIQLLDIDRTVKKSLFYQGGTSNARKLLNTFISERLAFYSERKNEPGETFTSELSPYLHFGQISPLFIYHMLEKASSEIKKEFLEELIVRRELSMNFVYYNDHYDSYECLPDWAKRTMEKHAFDRREYNYSIEDLENGQTHDLFWNAAEKEMIITGKMNGYMRMYWGKKIIEWSESPRKAYEIALYLNNKYNLDGRDPNGFAGVAWCFGKHDRPWGERSIFGSVRFMNDKGLRRKFDMAKYLEKVGEYEKEEQAQINTRENILYE